MAEESTTPSVSTKLYQSQSDAAERYQAHVLMSENRKLTKEEAVNELVRLGAKFTLPEGIFKQLFHKISRRA